MEVLRARHERDIDRASRRKSSGKSMAQMVVTGVLLQHRTPGLVRLDAAMAAEATDPTPPAHPYFRERSRQLERAYARGIAHEIETGRVVADVDPGVAAQQINSLIDGLHVQWLIDPSLDVRAILTSALTRLLPRPIS